MTVAETVPESEGTPDRPYVYTTKRMGTGAHTITRAEYYAATANSDVPLTDYGRMIAPHSQTVSAS